MKPSTATESAVPGSCAGHSRVPSPDRAHPASTGGCGFDNATALDTAIDMLNPQPAMVQGVVGPLLLPRQFLAARFLRRHEDLHLGQREGQETQIRQQRTPGR